MIKKLIQRIVYGKKATSEIYINYLRKIGVDIGIDCNIYSPIKTTIDEQYPWMITIGNHVRITEGVKILTHDYSWSVLKKIDCLGKKGNILGASGEVKIGNNVFIGVSTIILGGVNIGDNVVIGAGSVVTKSCKSNSVYAGNPAKYIMSIDEFYKRRNDKQLEEAKELAISYYNRYKKIPSESIFHEYFMLFSDYKNLNLKFEQKCELCGNYNETKELLNSKTRIFNGFDEFLNYCFNDAK